MARLRKFTVVRPPMPEDRRKAKIERVFNDYMEFLKEMGEESGSVGRDDVNK